MRLSPPVDPLAGTPYRTLAPLSAGGMGEVVLAEHRALGRQVVVKLLHERLAGRPDLVARMRLEGQALGRLRHPNVVAALDLGATLTGRPFLVLERLSGRTLCDELAARCTLPPAEAVGLVTQALAGLTAVHAAGLVHRNLKLDNVFVCDAARAGGPRVVKLLDFGVAKVVEVVDGAGPSPLAVPTDDGVAMGTPRFFAPEQAAGDAVDARTDVYAMGMVLYTLLAGRGPFEQFTELGEVLDAHLWITPEPPSTFAPRRLPPGLEAAVLRALAKQPANRYSSAARFAAALAPYGNLAATGAATTTDAAEGPAQPTGRPMAALFVKVLASSLVLTATGAALVEIARR